MMALALTVAFVAAFAHGGATFFSGIIESSMHTLLAALR